MTTSTKYDKSEIFRLANQAVRCGNAMDMSEALTEAWANAKAVYVEEKSNMTFFDLKNSLEDLSKGYQLHMSYLPIWSSIMKLADEKGHFASDIVERAVMSHNPISEKQAFVVAYFAKNNGLIIA